MTRADLNIRPARTGDAAAMLQIYAPIVTGTAISFELTAPSLAQFTDRVQRFGTQWAWIVAEISDDIVGYAYGSPHRDRIAYRWSTETSAYVAPGSRGGGVGSALYSALLPMLAEAGYCNAYAGIALPNPASVALHQRVGFREIGCFPAVGRKFGQWHDVAWFYRALRDQPPGAHGG